MELIIILEIVIGLLLIASLVGIAVQRLRMPYTVGLVLIGLGIAVVSSQLSTEFGEAFDVRGLLVPNLILTILVPPLIFEAAFHIKFEDLRYNLKAILAFAIPGVILTMFMVGGLIAWGTSLSFQVALVFGALIAATDPVAVVALFRTLGVPKQLLILLEGESLFNDGTAIVVFNLVLAIALGEAEFSTSAFFISFIRVAGGGLLVGAIVSYLVSYIIRLVNNHLIEVTLTGVAAYGSYLIAEDLHVSGVLAVVVAGLVIGNIGERGMSPTTRISLFNSWEIMSYLANSFAFLIIGLVIDLPSLISSWQAILIAILAVLLARAVVIYSLAHRIKTISMRMEHVIYWGGLRGAISLALALTIPAALGDETQLLLQDMTFGVVLFTLLVQGTTMPTVVKRLGFGGRNQVQESYERQQARAVASQMAFKRIKELRDEGLISDHAWQIMEPPMQRQIELRTEAVHEIMHADPAVEATELNNAFREALRAQRNTYNNLYNSGTISEETFSRLVTEVDAALLDDDLNYGDLILRRTKEQPPISKLVFASVQQNDLHDTLNMLGIMGIPTTRLASSFGPKRKPFTTILMGIEENQVERVIEAVIKCCDEPPSFERGLFDFLSTAKKEETIQVDNASVYVFNVEHYEEF